MQGVTLAHAESQSYEGPYFETSVNVVQSDDCQNVLPNLKKINNFFLTNVSECFCVPMPSCLSVVVTVAWSKMANRPKCTYVFVCVCICMCMCSCLPCNYSQQINNC